MKHHESFLYPEVCYEDGQLRRTEKFIEQQQSGTECSLSQTEIEAIDVNDEKLLDCDRIIAENLISDFQKPRISKAEEKSASVAAAAEAAEMRILLKSEFLQDYAAKNSEKITGADKDLYILHPVIAFASAMKGALSIKEWKTEVAAFFVA